MGNYYGISIVPDDLSGEYKRIWDILHSKYPTVDLDYLSNTVADVVNGAMSLDDATSDIDSFVSFSIN